jgi:hypothetical protein
MTLFVLLLFALLMASVMGQIPCDDAYGEHCPEALGWAVGECMKIHDSSLTDACKAYISLMETCKGDINEHCKDKEYTGDAISCLSEWTKPDLLSEGCKEALPKPATKKERGQTKEQRSKANKRKRIRNQAARQARGEEDL